MTPYHQLIWNKNSQGGRRLAQSHLIAHQTAQRPGSLSTDPPGDTAGPDLAGLRHDDVAVGRALNGMVQDVLWELSTFPTARGTVYNHHRITLYQRNNLELKKNPFEVATKLTMTYTIAYKTEVCLQTMFSIYLPFIFES